MRINSLTNTTRYSNKIGCKKNVSVYSKNTETQKLPTFPYYVNFTARRANKPTESTLLKDANNILDETIRRARIEIEQNDNLLNISDGKLQIGLINLEEYPLHQRLILKKYSNNQNLKKLLEMPKTTMQNSVILQQILNRENLLIKKFNCSTYENFANTNLDTASRLEAFALMNIFLSLALQEADSETLEKYLNAVASFKRVAMFESDNQNKIFEAPETKTLFDVAKKYWQEKELPKLINEDIEKYIYIEEVASKYETIKNLKLFSALPLEDKFFVARYFDLQQGNVLDNDAMVDILSNRTVANPAETIQEMSKKISIDEQEFENQIKNAANSLKTPEGIERLANYNIFGKSKDDNISLLSLYLLCLGKNELIQEDDYLKTCENLKSISEDEISEASKMIEDEWKKYYLPALIENEVLFKAREIDANTQIIKELKQINENLGKINIKLDNILVSLNQLVINSDRIYAKLNDPQKGAQDLDKTSALYIEAMKNNLSNLTPEQSKKLLEAFKTDGTKYLDMLMDKTTNPESKKIINNMQQAICRANNPGSVIARLEGYAPILILNQGITMGRKAIMHNARRCAEKEFIKNGSEAAMAKKMAAQQVATEGAGLSVIGIATAATVAAIAVGMYGIYKASNTHKQFSDLYFGE